MPTSRPWMRLARLAAMRSLSKYWVEDPQGIAWETFHSLSSIPVFGEDAATVKASEGDSACCIPLAKQPSDKADAACCVPKAAQPGKRLLRLLIRTQWAKSLTWYSFARVTPPAPF